jgi:hypothetical protein
MLNGCGTPGCTAISAARPLCATSSPRSGRSTRLPGFTRGPGGVSSGAGRAGRGSRRLEPERLAVAGPESLPGARGRDPLPTQEVIRIVRAILGENSEATVPLLRWWKGWSARSMLRTPAVNALTRSTPQSSTRAPSSTTRFSDELNLCRRVNSPIDRRSILIPAPRTKPERSTGPREPATARTR